jgi:hypothetical protein
MILVVKFHIDIEENPQGREGEKKKRKKRVILQLLLLQMSVPFFTSSCSLMDSTPDNVINTKICNSIEDALAHLEQAQTHAKPILLQRFWQTLHPSSIDHWNSVEYLKHSTPSNPLVTVRRSIILFS